MTPEQSSLFFDWCGKHPNCKGCKFNGNQCVASLANHNDDSHGKWIDKMEKLIRSEIKG